VGIGLGTFSAPGRGFLTYLSPRGEPMRECGGNSGTCKTKINPKKKLYRSVDIPKIMMLYQRTDDGNTTP
jgi:hypothetical protein